MNYNINVDIDTVSTSAAGIAKAIQDVEESMKTAQEAANEAIAGFGGVETLVGKKLQDNIQSLDDEQFSKVLESVEAMSVDLNKVGTEYNEQQTHLLDALDKAIASMNEEKSK